MSGPKRTRLSISLERRRKIAEKKRKANLKEMRERINNVQKKMRALDLNSKQPLKEEIRHFENEIKLNNFTRENWNRLRKLERNTKKLKNIQNEKDKVQNSYEELKSKVEIMKQIPELDFFYERFSEWLAEVNEKSQQNNVSAARNGINGIQKFWQKNESKIEDHLKSYKTILSVKNKLNSFLEEKFCTKGIEERVYKYIENLNELSSKRQKYQESELKSTIDNFFEKVDTIAEEYEQKKAEETYIRDSIISVMDSDAKGGVNKTSQLSKKSGKINKGEVVNSYKGKIEGTDVTVHFADESNQVIFNVDENSSKCMDTIEKANNKLQDRGISIDEVVMEKTGQKIYLNAENKNKKRQRKLRK